MKITPKTAKILIGMLFVFLIAFQQKARQGALEGLQLCFNALVPSLLPFMILCNAIVQLSAGAPSRFLSKPSRFFGLSTNEFSVFLLSLIGGYPSGAAVLCADSAADRKRKADLLPFLVHAGPGFCIGTVGGVLFGSTLLGVLIFLSETLAAFVLLFFFRRTQQGVTAPTPPTASKPLAAVFQTACTQTAQSLLTVCTVVIFFSAVLAPIRQHTPAFFRPCLAFFEVSAGVQSTGNIYLIALLLGFGGFSVFVQVQSFFGSKIPFLRYCVIRLAEGFLAAVFLKIALWLFPVRFCVSTVRYTPIFNPIRNIVALTLLAVFFLLSISLEKNGGNLKDDMLY